MSAAENELFSTVLDQSHRYLEFGLGGSSLLAVRAKLDTLVFVDSDAIWVTCVKEHPTVAPRLRDGSVSIIHADVGPVREWGNPVGRSHVTQWPRYVSTAWAEWLRRAQLPDLVLVDGRFRMAWLGHAANHP